MQVPRFIELLTVSGGLDFRYHETTYVRKLYSEIMNLLNGHTGENRQLKIINREPWPGLIILWIVHYRS